MFMDILDYAIQMERDGYEFYLRSAQKQKDEAARRMLEILADDEKRHEEILKGMQQGKARMIASKKFAGIKNVFQKLAAAKQPFINENGCLSGVLRQGVEIEARSVELYRKNAAQTADAAEKEIWQKLQAEEEKHQKLLELTLEYVDNPQTILENAEFLFYGYDR